MSRALRIPGQRLIDTELSRRPSQDYILLSQEDDDDLIVAIIRCFIYNLDSSPKAGNDDIYAIKNLADGRGLKTSHLRKISIRMSTRASKVLGKSKGTSGRSVCSVHSHLAQHIMFDLLALIKEEVQKYPNEFYNKQLINNAFASALMHINIVWDQTYFEKNNIIIESFEDTRFNPYKDHDLHQKNDCAGCYLRRIFSDPWCVGALLTAVEFRTSFNGLCGVGVPGALLYLETAWDILARNRHDLWGEFVDPTMIRARMSIKVDRLVMKEVNSDIIENIEFPCTWFEEE